MLVRHSYTVSRMSTALKTIKHTRSLPYLALDRTVDISSKDSLCNEMAMNDFL